MKRVTTDIDEWVFQEPATALDTSSVADTTLGLTGASLEVRLTEQREVGALRHGSANSALVFSFESCWQGLWGSQT